MLETLIRTSALFVLVAVAAFALRRSSATLRHTLWSFAVAGAILMPLLTKMAPFQWRVLPAPSAPAVVSSSRTAGAERARAPETAIAPASRVAPDVGSPSSLDQTTVSASRFKVTGPGVLMALWIVGALALLARLIHGLTTVHRIASRASEITDPSWRALTDRAIRALGVRVPVEVRRSEEVSMPFATGLMRPVIVLPGNTDSWNPQQREAVLLHELAHISRGDLAMNILSHVMRAAYWVNPLSWLAAHRLRVEGEKAADDAVLRGGALPSDYADHLLSIVRTVGNTVPTVALAMARRSDFEGRLLAILEPGVPRGRLSRVRAFALAALFVAATMPLAAMTRASAVVVSPPATPTSPTSETVASQSETGAPEAEVPAPKSEMKSSRQGKQQANTTPLPQPGARVAALSTAISDAMPSVRLAAVEAMGNLQDPAAIAALAKALKEDTDPRVREAAAWSLGEIDDNRAVPHLLEALKSEKVVKVKEKIVHALGEIDDPSAVNGVLAVLKDPAPEVRRAAVETLHELDDPDALPGLMSLTKDEDTEVRRKVADALGHFENIVALDAIISMTRDSDDEVRANAVESLSQFEDSRTIAPLVAALKDPSPHVREHAADGLGNHDRLKKAPAALIDALSDTDRDVRRQAANSLGNIGDEAAVPALKKLVADPDADTRRRAVEALKDIGGAEAIQALMGLLKDPDPEVRKTAAQALGRRRGD